jgi:excisionase family DNA binding protein
MDGNIAEPLSSRGSDHNVRLLLTPEEAAEALGIGRTFLYRLLTRQQLYSIKLGSARRIPLKALHDFVDELAALQRER